MTATDLWTYRDETLTGDVDMTGWKVEALDGEVGKVDEATYETGASYIVVDTGLWIFGKKVMLPAGVIERIDPGSERIFLAKTKDEIENAPEFDAAATGDFERHRGDIDRYWGERISDRAVL